MSAASKCVYQRDILDKRYYTLAEFKESCEFNRNPFFSYKGKDYVIEGASYDGVLGHEIYDAIEFITPQDPNLIKPLFVVKGGVNQLLDAKLFNGKSIREVYSTDEFQVIDFTLDYVCCNDKS